MEDAQGVVVLSARFRPNDAATTWALTLTLNLSLSLSLLDGPLLSPSMPLNA